MTQQRTGRRHMIIWWTFGALALAAAPSWAWPGSETVKGNGKIGSQARQLAHFTGVSLSLPAQVELRMGNVESATVEVDENLLALVETVVEKGSLEIRPKKGFKLEARAIKVVVQARQIDRLALGGSGSIQADALRSPKLRLDVGGSGSINVKGIESESVATAVGGSGSMKLAGNTRQLSVAIGGSGDVHAGQLKATDVEVSIGGSGDATVWASNALKAAVAGSGDVNYYGDPKVQSSVVGSGGAKRLGPAPH
jgi:hypothetical protein